MKIISLERGDFKSQNRASVCCFRSLLMRNIELKTEKSIFVNEKIKIGIIMERGAKSTKWSTVL